MKIGNANTDAYAVLKIPDFRWFVLCRFFLTMATQMQSVIIGWLVYSITKDPFSLGLVGLVEAIAFFSVSLFAGYAADNFDRQKIIKFNISFFCITASLLIWLNSTHSIPKNTLIVIIYVLIFFIGLSRGFIYPSLMALMARLVPKEKYANSSTWNSLAWHIAAVSGPATGGLVYGFAGCQTALVVVLIFYLTSFALFFGISKQQKPEKIVSESVIQNLTSGIRFVFKQPIIVSAMSLDMFAVLFGGAAALLPVFADTVLHVGAQGLGFLRAAPAFGAIFVSFFLAHRPPMNHTGKILLSAVAGFGLCMIVFALSENFYLSLAMLMLSGACDNISVVIRNTIMQVVTPDNMRGRIAAVNSIFIGSSNEIGAFESGLAAKIMGLVPSVIFGGASTIFIVGIASKVAKQLREVEFKNLLNKT